MRSGCVCIDEKVAIPNLLREALIDDIHASHPGTWGMICMATHCWWPYIHRELIVKATECNFGGPIFDERGNEVFSGSN